MFFIQQTEKEKEKPTFMPPDYVLRYKKALGYIFFDFNNLLLFLKAVVKSAYLCRRGLWFDPNFCLNRIALTVFSHNIRKLA